MKDYVSFYIRMPTAEGSRESQFEFAHYFGMVVKGGAVAVGILYAVGFGLLCAYESRFGIFEFDLLRTRIFLVGFTFSALCLLPAAAKHYGLAYYGPLKSVLNDTVPERKFQREVVLIAGFVYTAYFIAIPAANYLQYRADSPAPVKHPILDGVMAVSAYIILVASYSFIGKIFERHPSRAALLAILTSGGFIALLYVAGEEAMSEFIVFFTMVVFALIVFKADANIVRSLVDFRNWGAIAVLLSFYVLVLFGIIEAGLGGGAAQPVIVYLNRPVAWLSEGRIDVSLLDETERGFYVLPSQKTKALLIPQDSVSAIYFGPATDVPNAAAPTQATYNKQKQ